jgi:uncharacterized Zn finger protein
LSERLEAQGPADEAAGLVLELGSPEQQAFLLVQQGHLEEAVAIAEKHFSDLPGLVTHFADALVAAGAGSTAEAYMRRLLNTRSRSTALSWLTNYARQTGKLSVALELQRQTMREWPSFEAYKTLRELAQPLNCWEQLRPEIIAELEAKPAWSVLIEIALDEKNVPRALELLSRPKERWYVGSYDLRVAQAAEADYPQAAIDIYRRKAESLINARGRDNYREAASLLVKIRALSQRQGQSESWQEYISHLREQHKQLPALKDELRKAGL